MAPIGAMFALASIVGPLLGGALTDVSGLSVSGWTLCFWINIPTGVVAMALLWAFLPAGLAQTAATRTVTIDWLGSLLCAGAVICLALALTWGGGAYPWSNGRIIALLIVAAVLGLAFVAVELWYSAYPIVPMHLFVVRNWWSGAWVAFFSAFGMMSSIVYLPVWFR